MSDYEKLRNYEQLRAALSNLYDYLRHRHPPRMGGDHYPPSLRPLMAAASDALAKPEPATAPPSQMVGGFRQLGDLGETLRPLDLGVKAALAGDEK
jgi:hypothetical protein